MPIIDAPFDREQELEEWVFNNAVTFFGEAVLLRGFRIATPSGKHGVPDAFAFNFVSRSWWVVECELLAHGVWPHIAEQVTRFVVASRNSSTLREIRDRLFDAILSAGTEQAIAACLNADATRLLQQLEVFLETVAPAIVVFIDDTNQDLKDFCDALDVPTEIYRVNKFLVNGKAEYYSPDKNAPVIATAPEASSQAGSAGFDVIDQMGGGEVVDNRIRCYRLRDGRVIKLAYSKLHERHQAFWYGINPSSYEQARGVGCTHYVFVMGKKALLLFRFEP
jgi:hypothetical protein